MNAPSLPEKAATVVMFVFFVYATVVQFNDPDPLIWVPIYGLAAVLCVLYLMGRLPVRAAGVYTGLVVVYALYLAFRLATRHLFFDEREMVGIVEEGREMLGLVIVAAWTGFVTWRTHRRMRTTTAG
ncbi:transmembrane 220 family protein [Rhodocaloribacter sp.]